MKTETFVVRLRKALGLFWTTLYPKSVVNEQTDFLPVPEAASAFAVPENSTPVALELTKPKRTRRAVAKASPVAETSTEGAVETSTTEVPVAVAHGEVTEGVVEVTPVAAYKQVALQVLALADENGLTATELRDGIVAVMSAPDAVVQFKPADLEVAGKTPAKRYVIAIANTREALKKAGLIIALDNKFIITNAGKDALVNPPTASKRGRKAGVKAVETPVTPTADITIDAAGVQEATELNSAFASAITDEMKEALAV